jgi:ABC-type glutathione transport system ATPase component
VLALLVDVKLPSPETLRSAFPHQLSGGQRQRVMIAMALAMKPALIIADEPTTALDVTSQAQVLRLLNELRDKHDNGVLFITHDFDVVAEIADRVIVMQHGRIVEAAAPPRCCDNPQQPYTKKLLAAVPRGEFGAQAQDGARRHRAVGEGPACALRDRELLQASRRRVVNALGGVTLSLARGETLGIVGESGSGKTTLGRCLAHMAAADVGPDPARRHRRDAPQPLAMARALQARADDLPGPVPVLQSAHEDRQLAGRRADELRRIARGGAGAHAAHADAGAASTRARWTAFRTSSRGVSDSACRSPAH